jgi:antibiotic biosynthesis monooxygenase (ABM) superfamily enzyme
VVMDLSFKNNQTSRGRVPWLCRSQSLGEHHVAAHPGLLQWFRF